jgi:sugar phosphate isomerase/epimerase
MFTPALFSVSYAGLWGQAALSLPEFIQHAARLGYRHVMLAGKRPHLSVVDSDLLQLDAVIRVMKECGVKAPVIGAYIDTAGGSAAEVPYLEMQLAYIDRLAEFGPHLDPQIIRVFTGYERTDIDTTRIWSTTVQFLREACDRVQSRRITIAVQNHHDLAVETAALLELLSDVDRPNCKLGFDAWSPALRGEDLYTAAKTAAPHTVITTNADYVRFERFAYRPELVNYERRGVSMVRAVPFGTGFIDYPAFFAGLNDGGFTGIATYEMCSPLRGGGHIENLDTYARTYLEWMQSHGWNAPTASSSLRGTPS